MQEKGFVLMDVMIASVIVTLGMLSIMMGYNGMMAYTARNNTYNQTLYVAQQTLERLKKIDGTVIKPGAKIDLRPCFQEEQGNQKYHFHLKKADTVNQKYEVEVDDMNQAGAKDVLNWKYGVKVEKVAISAIPDELVAYRVTVTPEKKEEIKVELIGYYYLETGGDADG